MPEAMRRPLPLGIITATHSIAEELSLEEQITLYRRHASGDWGDVSGFDAAANDRARDNDERVLSSYTASNGRKVWVITEADRSSTTILYPEEY